MQARKTSQKPSLGKNFSHRRRHLQNQSVSSWSRWGNRRVSSRTASGQPYGGKFKNGAITGSFSYVFGSIASRSRSTGGRVLSGDEAEGILGDIRSKLTVDPSTLIDGGNGAISYSPIDMVKITFALDKLAIAQGESFLSGDLFGPERSMLARVILGKGDNSTVAWFLHERAEASLLQRSSAVGSSYVSAQEIAHRAVLSSHGNSSTSLYHPSVVRAYDRQFGPAYRRY